MEVLHHFMHTIRDGKIPFAGMNRKHWLLLFSIFALLALVILAADLHDVTFQDARPLNYGETITIQFTVEKVAEQIASVPLWKHILFWGILFLIILLISSILSPELRKRILWNFIRFAVFTWAFFFLIENYRLLLPSLAGGEIAQGGGAVAPQQSAADLVFQPPGVSPLLDYLISFGIVLALLVSTWGLSRWWRRSRVLRASVRPLEEIAAITQSSLDDLASGLAWEDVVVQCYARMSAAVGRRRGLHRAEAMTPREFAARLERAGLPGDAVLHLTRLFEAVRYGARKSSQDEVNQAVACLTSILHYCREAR